MYKTGIAEKQLSTLDNFIRGTVCLALPQVLSSRQLGLTFPKSCHMLIVQKAQA